MLDKTIQDWRSLAADLSIEGRAFTNGQYRDSMAGETRATMVPADGKKSPTLQIVALKMQIVPSKLLGQRLKAVFGRQWRLSIEKWCWFAGQS